MKMKSGLYSLIFFLLFCITPTGIAQANKVYIDIDAPGFQQFPIAVCDFQSKRPGQGSSPDPNPAISDDIRNYLQLSGIFYVLDKKSFLVSAAPGNPEKIHYPDWSVIGADFLLCGEMISISGELTAEARLYDVTRGKILFQKRYGSADKTGDRTTLARAIASDIMMTLTGDEGDFNTQIAFVIKKDGRADIHTIRYDSSGLIPVTAHQSIVLSPRWSPDGQLLAFTSYKNGRPEVYLRHLKTGKERKVASFGGLNLCGSFSPDSRKLLLTLSKDENEEIYTLEIETLAFKRLTRHSAIDVSPAWSPDGNKIAFVSSRSGSPQIFVMDADGNNVKRITYDGNYNTSPSWSPRGDRIAYEGRIHGKYQIFSVDGEGGNLLQLTFDDADNEYPSWSPSGRQIVFSSRQGAKSRISIMNANGLNVRILKEHKDILMMPSWSPVLK